MSHTIILKNSWRSHKLWVEVAIVTLLNGHVRKLLGNWLLHFFFYFSFPVIKNMTKASFRGGIYFG